MAWIERRKADDGTIHYRIRDRIGGKIKTVVKDAGRWKEIAMARLLEYEKQDAAGDAGDLLPKKRLPIEEMCDLNLKFHAPNLRDGLNARYDGSFYNLCLRMNRLKDAWKGHYADEINSLMVRDFLAQFKTKGNRLRWLGVIGKMFRNFEEWSEEGKILPASYQLPAKNPAHQWRRSLKPAEKREDPDQRVLTPQEWQRFSKHLTKRAYAICDLALHRCLRKSDIKKISHLSIVDGYIKGLQSKTGEPFAVPVMPQQPLQYSFKNFSGDFEKAQILAGMNYPADHPLHFSMKDLRRTGATWAYQDTKDLEGVRKLLGHRRISTTQRYLNIDASDVAKVVEAIARRSRSVGAPVEHFPTKEAKRTNRV